MEATYKYGPQSYVKKTASGALSAGEVIVIGNRVGVVMGSSPIASGDEYILATSGVFSVTTLGTDTPAEGALMYWDAGNNRATTTASTHKSCGLAVEAKGSGATSMLIDLNASVASGTI